MEYKITFKNQIKALRRFIFGSLLYYGIFYFFYQNGIYEIYPLIVLIVFFLVLVFPALLLNIEYYLINKNSVVDINTITKTVSFNNHQSIIFSKIEKVTLVMSPVLYRNGSNLVTAFDNYHYALLKMKDGEEFFFTSLMTPKVEDAFKEISGVPIEKKRCFIASPLLLRCWHYLWD
jgi:hypothetical protein